MGAPKVTNQIPDLQLEWAKSYPNHSIRDFLTNIKGFSRGQYKRVIALAPKGEWSVLREEIQNQIAAESLNAHVEEAKKVNERFMKTAQVAVAIATKQMAGNEMDAKGLLSAISAVEKAQKVYFESLGLNKTWTEHTPITNKSPEPVKSEVKPSIADQLSYDDIIEFIEFRRELKVKRALNASNEFNEM